ncbi:Vegetative incompatibility protein HET-E-1 [Cytospora mali]|uniref:Vegetative incompatibility protein HET-E-1 n=1 Tax=Cytospora mali TaxID=578113 RepID=A0A194UPA3_CYTMA|nr:Vegetative incompatibility protein HET-E-1 [Valsa mali var. pyri (nom. inval.)]
MRLLNSKTYEFREFLSDDLPHYAILSHTWGDDEVSYPDMMSPALRDGKLGWKKIELCCRQAREEDLDYVWVDTCCIDKSSSTELQEAINSMFRWYEKSTECYVFVVDFEIPKRLVGSLNRSSTRTELFPALCGARWFSRGWTLQELIAPESVRFFDAEWREFGDKISHSRQIASITGIRESVLLDSVVDVRHAMDAVCVAQKMSWAANRVTTRVEDMAYCLLGIFDINMPLLYGEGPKAFQRLQEEIMKMSTDQSLLAWGFGCEVSCLDGVSPALAQSPSDFAGCSDLDFKGSAEPDDSFSMVQRGLCLKLPVVSGFDGEDQLIYCLLNCITSEMENLKEDKVLAVPLFHISTTKYGVRFHPDDYYRLSLRIPLWVGKEQLGVLPRREVYLPRCFRHEHTTHTRLHFEISTADLPQGYFIRGVYPPEISENEYVTAGPAQTLPYDVCVHLSSHSPLDPDFIVAINNKEAQKYTIRRITHRRKSIPGLASDVRVSGMRSRQVLAYPALRNRVLTLAKEILAESSDEFEEQQLADLVVDRDFCLRIKVLLREKFHGYIINPDVFFFGCITVEDVLEKLRFVTRPSFALEGKTRAERTEVSLLAPRGVRAAVVGVSIRLKVDSVKAEEPTATFG